VLFEVDVAKMEKLGDKLKKLSDKMEKCLDKFSSLHILIQKKEGTDAND